MRGFSRIAFIAAALGALIIGIIIPVSNVGAGDLDDKVTELVERIANKDFEEMWPLAREVEKLGVRARVAIRKAERANRQKNPKVSIALAYALFNMDDEDNAVTALLDIIGNEKLAAEARNAALECLDFLEPDGAGEKLVKMKDTVLDPDVKIILCRVAWSLAKDTDMRDLLLQYAESDDESIRIRAAFALASLDEFDSIRGTLRALTREPSARGRLARLYKQQSKLFNEAKRAAGLTEKPLIRKLSGRVKQLEDEVDALRDQLVKNVPISSDPLFKEVIDKINTYYMHEDKTKREDLLNAAIHGICLFGLDKHTSYMDAKTMKEFMESINQRYEGIGARVSKRANEFLSIEQPIYNGPAYRAGLRAGDQVTEVNGVSVIGKTISDVVAMLKGPGGTPVKIKVFRPGRAITHDFFTKDFTAKSRALLPEALQDMFKNASGGKVNIRIVDPGWMSEAEMTFKEVDIKRQGISLQSVRFRMYPGKVGYIQLEQFGERGVGEMEDALTKLERKGMEALVFDLRDNGGGLLDAAVKIVDKFVKGRNLIVYSKGRHPIRAPYSPYYTSNRGTHPDFPMVILVNKGSASASEIVAGALKALGRATLLGKKTYGKGSVQQPFPLANGKGMLKLTVARYYFHDNSSIHQEGIQPDVVVSQPDISAAVMEEAERIHIDAQVKNYVLKHYREHKSLFIKLAETDFHDSAAYPGFDKWYKGLDTTLGKDLARRYLRIEVRRRVQDAEGKEFPPDLVDDLQMQRAISLALTKVGKKVTEFAQYAYFADKMPKEEEKKSSGK